MKARYGDSGLDTLRSRAQLPPTMAGSSTLCPRLETGNISEMPWIRPTTPASRYVRWIKPGSSSRLGWHTDQG